MLSGLGVDSDANKKEEASNVFTLLTSLAEMKRFELLRRFEADLPHFECGPFNHLGTSPNIHPDKGRFLQILEFPLEQGPP